MYYNGTTYKNYRVNLSKKRTNTKWMVLMMNTFRYLPAIDQLKRDSAFTNLLETEAISDKVLTDWLREQVDIVRTELHDHIIPEEKISRKALNDRIFNR